MSDFDNGGLGDGGLQKSKDKQKKFPINSLLGYTKIMSQLVDEDTIAVYETQDGYKIGEITFYKGTSQPSFWPQCGSGIMTQLPQDIVKELLSYMEFIKVFGISIKHNDNGDTIKRDI